jgi:hypothetical protein
MDARAPKRGGRDIDVGCREAFEHGAIPPLPSRPGA